MTLVNEIKTQLESGNQEVLDLFNSFTKSKSSVKKPRLFAIADLGVQTGFATVMEELLLRLHDKFEIRAMGVSYTEEDAALHLPFLIYRAAYDPQDSYGFKRLPSLLVKFLPDYILLNNDLGVVNRWIDVIHNTYNKINEGRGENSKLPVPKIVSYCPWDGPVFRIEESIKCLENSTMAVYTQYGIDEILAGAKRTPGLNYDTFVETFLPKIHVVGHTVNQRNFYPIPTESARKLFSNQVDPEAFIVGWVNRNQPRKFLTLALEGCRDFLLEHEDAYLMVRASLKDVSGNFLGLAKYLGIERKLIVVGSNIIGGLGIPIEQLNLVYNCFDVFLSTSLSEGWGLTENEAAACRKPLILPNNTVRPELWGGAAYLMDCKFPISGANFAQSRGALPLPEQIGNALEFMYTNPTKRAEYAELAYQRAIGRPSWDDLANKLTTIIQS